MGLFGRGRPTADVRHVWGHDPIWPEVAPLLGNDVVELRGVLGPPVEPVRLRELFGAENIVAGERLSRRNDEYRATVATDPATMRAAFEAESDLQLWTWEQGLMRDVAAHDSGGNRLWELDSGTGVVHVHLASRAAFELLGNGERRNPTRSRSDDA